MDTENSYLSYSTSSGDNPVVGNIDEATYRELNLSSLDQDEYDDHGAEQSPSYDLESYYEWCHDCQRATYHQGEH